MVKTGWMKLNKPRKKKSLLDRPRIHVFLLAICSPNSFNHPDGFSVPKISTGWILSRVAFQFSRYIISRFTTTSCNVFNVFDCPLALIFFFSHSMSLRLVSSVTRHPSLPRLITSRIPTQDYYRCRFELSFSPYLITTNDSLYDTRITYRYPPSLSYPIHCNAFNVVLLRFYL